MLWFFLFIFGVAIGSFLNVVALRYDGEHFLLNPKQIGGRSHCPHCKKTLRWFELIPLVSFIIQGGRCRRCKARLGFQYPVVELLSGLIFVFVPLHFSSSLAPPFLPLSILWVAVFEILLLIAVIDILLSIIPDELNIALFLLGLFDPQLIGAAFGLLFFGGIVLVTRGRGMGLGDVKLALPLGLLFGLPDMIMISFFAFVIGAVYSIFVITLGKKTMKSAVPFGPFLVLSSTIIFFWGSGILNWYFHMIGL